MGKTSTTVRWRSLAMSLALAMLLALLVVPPGAFAHPGEHHTDHEAEGIGVDVLTPGLEAFLPSFQWSGTPAVADETAELVYAGSGCSPANYLGGDFEGKIALVDNAARSEDPSDPCPIATFAQKVQSAEKAGAIGFVQVPADEGRSNATAVTAEIPALETKERSAEAVAVLDAVKSDEAVTAMLTDKTVPIPSMPHTPCEGGQAGPFACDGVDLMSLVAADEFNSAGISDLWGWTDPASGDEYVIIGKTNGVGFFRVTDPTDPEYLGELPNPGLIQAVWHDIKVYDNHAFIVSESERHGMTVFDLRRLRDVEGGERDETSPWDADARYELTSAAHNLEINTETGMAYILGGNAGIVAPDHCLSGLHMVDINDPTTPTFAGCYVLEGGPGTAARTVGSPVTEVSPAAYVHDAQCVVYSGPDPDHQGKDICVTAAEDKVVVVDVTNPLAALTLGTTQYEHVGYAHQGWLDEDQRYWFLNDELAQLTFPEEAPNTRTVVLDLTDLDDPKVHSEYFPPNPVSPDEGMKAITHNNYVVGEHLYQSNYASGLRVADISDIAGEGISEVAYFDTYPTNDGTNFDGTWSNYPFFASGTIAVSGRAEGLFLLRLAEEGDELGVAVDCEDCPIEIRAGETGTAHVGVTNTGDVEDTYGVSVEGLPEGWTATVQPNPVSVAAGEHGDTDLAITVPRQARAGTYTFAVRATSQTDPAIGDRAKIEVDVVKGRPSDPGPPATGASMTADTSATGGGFTAVRAGATGTAGDPAVPVALLLTAVAMGWVIPAAVRRRMMH
jgi:choice-of-anchor B domain-containing protein